MWQDADTANRHEAFADRLRCSSQRHLPPGIGGQYPATDLTRSICNGAAQSGQPQVGLHGCGQSFHTSCPSPDTRIRSIICRRSQHLAPIPGSRADRSCGIWTIRKMAGSRTQEKSCWPSLSAYKSMCERYHAVTSGDARCDLKNGSFHALCLIDSRSGEASRTQGEGEDSGLPISNHSCVRRRCR